MQDETELLPEPVGEAENLWVEETAEQESRTSQETPPPDRSSSKQGNNRKKEEDCRHDQPEGPVRRALDFICTAPGFVDTRGGYRSMARPTIVDPEVIVRSRFAPIHRQAAFAAARAAAGV